MRSSGYQRDERVPAVDERLVAPESRYEIIGGKVEYVAPADEPHGTRHAKVTALIEAHVHDDFDVAVDMLTRTSEKDDIAPDVSVFPRVRDAVTGGRQLEQLAFEVVSTQSLSNAGEKAVRLVERGVRRVFAIDVERRQLLAWSPATGTWEILPRKGVVEDAALAVPLPIEALVESVRCDDAIALALLTRGNPVLVAALDARRIEGREEGRQEAHRAGREEGYAAGRAEAVLAVLIGRGFVVEDAARQRILATRDNATLDRWLRQAGTCASIDDLTGD